MERTFIIIKPDAVQRGLVGEIIGRFERRGLKLSAMKFLQVDDALARQHYAVHAERPFFGGLISYITSSPVVALVMEGTNARYVDSLPEPVSLVTIDASFISLKLILPVVRSWLAKPVRPLPWATSCCATSSIT